MQTLKGEIIARSFTAAGGFMGRCDLTRASDCRASPTFVDGNHLRHEQRYSTT